MNPKIFTIEEANKLIKKISSLIPELQRMKREIDLQQVDIDLIEMLHSGKSSKKEGGLSQKVDKRIDALNEMVQQYTLLFEKIEKMGPVIKDVDQGLIDFYHVRDQELVFLCWKQGDKEIEYWHDLESGFSGRESL